MTIDGISFGSITELGAMLRRREISSTELTGICLERLNTTGRELNAVVTVRDEAAMAEAALADAEMHHGVDRGPLHGIPYGVKDVIASTDSPTTWGVEAFRERVFHYDATVISRLRNAGAVQAAKLATIELAGGMGYTHPNASFTGATANPWNREKWAGGSSSGSAAAVAAGLVPFAIGSDTSGSILLPAAWTGTYGLRATYGRVSRYGAMTLCWTLDRLGPICRNAHDCGLVLNEIAGPDSQDRSTLNRDFRYGPKVSEGGFRFGAVSPAAHNTDPDIATNYANSLALLQTLGAVEEVTLPDLPYAEVLEVICTAEASAAFDDFLATGQNMKLTAQKARVSLLAGALLPAHAYIRAQRVRRHIATAVNDLLSGYDAIVAPTIGTFAPGVDMDFAYMLPEAFAEPLNYAGVLAGSPTISIPNGFSRAGMPTSIQLAGARMAENSILSAATALENLHGINHIRPPAS